VRTTVGLAALFAVGVLALSACATQSHLPARPTPADEQTYSISIVNLQLAAAISPYQIGLAEPTPPHYLSFDESDWGAGMASCLRERGFIDYVATDEGSMHWVNDQVSDTGLRRLAWYECGTEFSSPRAAQFGLLSRAQRAYLYRYYADWLVPCFELSGYDIVDPPTKAQFVDDPLQHGWWNPYFAMATPLTRVEIGQLVRACPPAPAGLSLAGSR
jgi:hypothetical protein